MITSPFRSDVDHYDGALASYNLIDNATGEVVMYNSLSIIVSDIAELLAAGYALPPNFNPNGHVFSL